jgi:hypothetical protein
MRDMRTHRRRRSDWKEKHVLSPIEGGIVDKIQPLLQYTRPFPRPGSFGEVFLLLRNNTDRQVEGWLTITPPPDWVIEPGRQLIVAIRPQGVIVAEFYLSVPFLPSAGPHFLRIKVTEGQDLLAEAAFDLREGLLFAIDDKLHS